MVSDFTEHICHVGSSHDTHSIIQSELIPGGKDVKKGDMRCLFTAREPNVHRSLPRKGLRRDEAQNCRQRIVLKPNMRYGRQDSTSF